MSHLRTPFLSSRHWLQVTFCRNTLRGFIVGLRTERVSLNFRLPVSENSVRHAEIFLLKINFQTYHYLPFESVRPVLSLICVITSCYFNMGAICLGVHEQTRSSSLICRRLLIFYQEYFYKNKQRSEIPTNLYITKSSV